MTTLDIWGIVGRFPVGVRDLCLVQGVRTGSGHKPASSSKGRGTWCWPRVSSTEDKNERSYSSTPTYGFLAWRGTTVLMSLYKHVYTHTHTSIHTLWGTLAPQCGVWWALPAGTKGICDITRQSVGGRRQSMILSLGLGRRVACCVRMHTILCL